MGQETTVTQQANEEIEPKWSIQTSHQFKMYNISASDQTKKNGQLKFDCNIANILLGEGLRTSHSFSFKDDLEQKYYTPKVQHDRGSMLH